MCAGVSPAVSWRRLLVGLMHEFRQKSDTSFVHTAQRMSYSVLVHENSTFRCTHTVSPHWMVCGNLPGRGWLLLNPSPELPEVADMPLYKCYNMYLYVCPSVCHPLLFSSPSSQLFDKMTMMSHRLLSDHTSAVQHYCINSVSSQPVYSTAA